nr:S41 family peptidase [Mycoplasmopsis bovis]
MEKALKEAKSKGVKNIIFNVTLNGGGYIGAAYEIMGFLTDKPFNVWTYNPLSGEKKIEIIKSKKQKYDFNYFVLTAPVSFSAGNIFPQLVRDNNLGKNYWLWHFWWFICYWILYFTNWWYYST